MRDGARNVDRVARPGGGDAAADSVGDGDAGGGLGHAVVVSDDGVRRGDAQHPAGDG